MMNVVDALENSSTDTNAMRVTFPPFLIASEIESFRMFQEFHFCLNHAPVERRCLASNYGLFAYSIWIFYRYHAQIFRR